jgi:hypothetical protein
MLRFPSVYVGAVNARLQRKVQELEEGTNGFDTLRDAMGSSTSRDWRREPCLTVRDVDRLADIAMYDRSRLDETS